MKLATADEHPEVIEQMLRLGASPWPEFLNHDADDRGRPGSRRQGDQRTGALVPVEIDCEGDVGDYREPACWVRHRTATSEMLSTS